MKNGKQHSLFYKITSSMIVVVLIMLVLIGGVVAISMRDISNTLIESNREMGKTSSEATSVSMSYQMKKRLQELAENKAIIADDNFEEFQQAVRIVADETEKLYEDPGAYGRRPVPLPDASRDGSLAIQVLYSAAADPADPQILREMQLLGNLQDTLLVINDNFEGMASNYFASETGIMIQADYISGSKFDEEGNLMPLEAKERPWYAGAAATGDVFLTPVTKDLHTDRMAIMCGVPVYHDGQLMGVAGAGMYLDNMEMLIRSIDLGDNGDSCILNQDGQILFSTFEEGTLSTTSDGSSLQDKGERELAVFAGKAIDGNSGVALLNVDGSPHYVAYAPMKTVGWCLLVVMPQDVVEAPTAQLQSTLSIMTEHAIQEANQHIRESNILLICLLFTAVLAILWTSFRLSNRIVSPIRKLTEEVRSLEGDNLDFSWDMDTGDETQVLASSFQSLTERMKNYIRDIQTITAEQERIGTELSLASRIQEDMLPSTFPAFPDRTEFDIYAMMDPAKEVGGDFYDFFLVDDDHLALVIADVSGKGVPAALFMMISKTILANIANMGKSPKDVLDGLNQTICANNREEMFITVWLGILEISTGKLTAANAGHEYPVLKQPDGSFTLLKDAHSFVVGGFPDEIFSDYEIRLQPGSKLFVYTDGVPEATDSQRNQFGIARMVDVLNEDSGRTPQELLEAVKHSVGDFVGDADQFDDLTMLCLEYRGTELS